MSRSAGVVDLGEAQLHIIAGRALRVDTSFRSEQRQGAISTFLTDSGGHQAPRGLF